MEIILRSKQSFVVDYFIDKPEMEILQAFSYFILVTFTLPFPLILARVISSNKPTGTLENPEIAYDVDGEAVPFDDKLYHRLVAEDTNQLKCPYRSLYKGFERRWAHYKV